MPLRRAALAALVFVSCVAHAALVALPGTTPQHSIASTPFPNPLAFQVTDDSGAPVAGATVSFTTANSMYAEPGANCRLGEFSEPFSYCSGITAGDGTVAFPRMTETFAGTYTVPVKATLGSVSLGQVTLTFTVDPKDTPATIEVISGAGQRVLQMSQFPTAVTLRLTRAGMPIPNAMIQILAHIVGPYATGNAGNGQAWPTTDATGMAFVYPRSDSAVGDGELDASYVDVAAGAIVHASVPYTVTNARGGFDLALQGLWWGGVSQNGWGFSMVQHGNNLFNVLFTYDAAGNPTWYVQPEPKWVNGFGGQAMGNMYSPRGTPWYAYDASKLVVGQPVGWIGPIFNGERAADLYVLSWMSESASRSASAAIVPQDFARGGTSPIQGVADMWWGGPQQNGWGVAIHEEPGALFMVWFTYDANGSATWFVMPGGDWRDDSTYGGMVYRTQGMALVPGPYDPSKFSITPAGGYTLHFDSKDHATLEVNIDGRGVTLDLTRQPF